MTTIKEDKYIIALTKFRVSSHDLLFKKGTEISHDKTEFTINMMENE